MKSSSIPTYDLLAGDERALPLEVQPLEVQRENYDFGKPHRHGYFEIFYFVRGGGVHEIDFQRYEIRSSSLHFVAPGQVHLLQRAPGSHGYVVLFSRDFFFLDIQSRDIFNEMPFFTPGSPRPTLQLGEQELAALDKVIRLMNEEYRSNVADKTPILRSYLDIVLAYARRLYEREEPGVTRERSAAVEQIRRFRALVEEHFRSVHSVSEYANLMCISANHLNDSCQKALAMTAGDVIHDRIVLEAKRLLYHSNDSIKEIAFALNFADPSYFGRFFRNHAGIAPGSFRRDIREKYQ